MDGEEKQSKLNRQTYLYQSINQSIYLSIYLSIYITLSIYHVISQSINQSPGVCLRCALLNSCWMSLLLARRIRLLISSSTSRSLHPSISPKYLQIMIPRWLQHEQIEAREHHMARIGALSPHFRCSPHWHHCSIAATAMHHLLWVK